MVLLGYGQREEEQRRTSRQMSNARRGDHRMSMAKAEGELAKQ